MPGAFGLKEDHHHGRVPVERLAENRTCADIFWLYREGLLLIGASVTLQTAHGNYLIATREAGKIEIDGKQVRVSWHKSLPLPVFVCPACSRDCYRLYELGGVWACRKCHRLDYACRHRHRSNPGLNRVLYLRKKIGASLVPFSEIAPRLPHARRYWRIVAEIRRLEAGLVQHARRDVCDVLERRHD